MKDTRGYRRAVRVIVERDNKILLGKRHNKGEDNPVYLFPGGGVEEDESVEDATVKEVKEEVGLAVNDVREIGYEIRYDKVHKKPERAKLYRGSHDVWTCAKYDGKDTSELGSQGDAFNYMWLTLDEVVKVYQGIPDQVYAKRMQIALNAYRLFLKKASLEHYTQAQAVPPVKYAIW